MARAGSSNNRYLEVKDGKYRVVVSVPRFLYPELGTKLKKSLHTDSLSTANALKWPIVNEFLGVIETARSRGGKDPLAREALALSRMRAQALTPEDEAGIDDAISVRLQDIAGPALEFHEHPEGNIEVHHPERSRAARAFAELAYGKATPISHFHADYLQKLKVKPRTRADDERALRYLEDWCHQNDVPPMLQAITRKVAMRFADGIGTVSKGQSPVTLQKYINRLRVFWEWLVKREHVETNVWIGVKLEKEDVPHDEEERPFTRGEMLALLEGTTTPHLHDLMRIGALTGARLDVIVDLRVRDCEDGVFHFKPQKKEKAVRLVPIHSALASIILRRTSGKAPDDHLFPEWPAPAANSMRERSFKASNAFTDYRRKVGVDQRIPGKRRSLVNFHSFRRWFITSAEQAGQSGDLIAAVVGHKRSGITLGRYSAGPLLDQARRCVEAVELPTSKADAAQTRSKPDASQSRSVTIAGEELADMPFTGANSA